MGSIFHRLVNVMTDQLRTKALIGLYRYEGGRWGNSVNFFGPFVNRPTLKGKNMRFSHKEHFIAKTYLYNFDPIKPHIIFLIFTRKHRLWVLVTSTHNLCLEQKYEKYQFFFHLKFFSF